MNNQEEMAESLRLQFYVQNCTDIMYTHAVLEVQEDQEPAGSYDFDLEDTPGKKGDLIKIPVEDGQIKIETDDTYQLYEWDRIKVVARKIVKHLGIVNGVVNLRSCDEGNLKFVSSRGYPTEEQKRIMRGEDGG